ncbi:MAG: hypothetical protein HQL93_08200 [Magnetococcales bacterium]|nr:hypothetical protein [Magnetococcales bacterium]
MPNPAWACSYDEAPHRQPEHTSLSDDEKVRNVVERLALPGFATPEERRRKIGLVAINFTLSAEELYKPTVLDALDSGFFLPGPTKGCAGMTYPLVSGLDRADINMAGQGVKEYICVPVAVPVQDSTGVAVELVGFFAD